MTKTSEENTIYGLHKITWHKQTNRLPYESLIRKQYPFILKKREKCTIEVHVSMESCHVLVEMEIRSRSIKPVQRNELHILSKRFSLYFANIFSSIAFPKVHFSICRPPICFGTRAFRSLNAPFSFSRFSCFHLIFRILFKLSYFLN